MIVLTGCGGDSGHEKASTVTVTESASAAKIPSTKPTSRSPAEKAEATVRRYYKEINRGVFSIAWPLLSPTLQAELGGFAAWRDGYETTVNTRAHGVRARQASAGSAVVELEIESTDIDECDTMVHQTFSGTWSLAFQGGRFRGIAFDVEKTSGGTPALDPSACEYEETEPYVPSESGSGCDANYTGCVPISAGDVDCDEVGEGVEVVGEDVYGLDLEEDGYACETY